MGLLFSYIRLYWIHRSYVAFSTSKGRMKKRYIICSVKGKHVTIMPYIRVQTGVQKKMTVLQTSYLSVFANGSNLRVPSRALNPRKTSFWRVQKTVHRTVFHLALIEIETLLFHEFASTCLYSINTRRNNLKK